MSFNHPKKVGIDSVAALSFPLTSHRHVFGTGVLSALIGVVLVLRSFPKYSAQILAADLGYVDEAVVAQTANTYASIGWVGLELIVAYAILAGVALTNVAAQVRLFDISSIRDLVGIIPGLFASRGASCGAGVLKLVGFAGVLAAIPFDGNLLRIGGIALLLIVLARSSDPRACEVR